MLVSVVAPMHNEAPSLEAFYRRLTQCLADEQRAREGGSIECEIVLVDDGSTDSSVEIARRLALSDPRVRLVVLSRNFGKEAATTAGIQAATGDATIVIDSDGQHPPELLGEFLDRWQAGAEVVIGIRTNNPDAGALKRLSSYLFYTVSRRLGGNRIIANSTDYCLLGRQARLAFAQYGQRLRMTRSIVQAMGYSRAFVEFKADSRMAGQARYSTRKLAALARDAIVSSSSRPLVWSAGLGAILASLALMSGATVLVEQVFLGDPFGWDFTGAAMLGILIVFVAGLILSSQGIIGVYLAAAYRETVSAPLYLIDGRRSIRPGTASNDEEQSS
jgi:glycosyltransferase involved in cell wall biosynthesis